jgi:uncharacterized membrane protein
VYFGANEKTSAILGWTYLGFIPWFGGILLTIMHGPLMIGGVLEGQAVGLAVGFIFGGFSRLQAVIALSSPSDIGFTNPLLAILHRLFIGVIA